MNLDRNHPFVVPLKDYPKSDKPNKNEQSDNESRELWKSIAIASLQGGCYIPRCDNSYVKTATTIADEIVVEFKKRFPAN